MLVLFSPSDDRGLGRRRRVPRRPLSPSLVACSVTWANTRASSLSFYLRGLSFFSFFPGGKSWKEERGSMKQEATNEVSGPRGKETPLLPARSERHPPFLSAVVQQFLFVRGSFPEEIAGSNHRHGRADLFAELTRSPPVASQQLVFRRRRHRACGCSRCGVVVGVLPLLRNATSIHGSLRVISPSSSSRRCAV